MSFNSETIKNQNSFLFFYIQADQYEASILQDFKALLRPGTRLSIVTVVKKVKELIVHWFKKTVENLCFS